jgi:hypothetical protein
LRARLAGRDFNAPATIAPRERGELAAIATCIQPTAQRGTNLRGIGVTDASTDGAAIAHCPIGNTRGDGGRIGSFHPRSSILDVEVVTQAPIVIPSGSSSTRQFGNGDKPGRSAAQAQVQHRAGDWPPAAAFTAVRLAEYGRNLASSPRANSSARASWPRRLPQHAPASMASGFAPG